MKLARISRRTLSADIWFDGRASIGFSNILSNQIFNNFMTLSRSLHFKPEREHERPHSKPSSRKAEQNLQSYSRSFVPWICFQNHSFCRVIGQTRFSSCREILLAQKSKTLEHNINNPNPFLLTRPSPFQTLIKRNLIIIKIRQHQPTTTLIFPI